MTPRILVACVGNIFLGDDGLVCRLRGRLQRLTFPTA